jgi:uroporphyrinogen-III synthase
MSALAGRGVAVTRAEPPGGALARRLSAAGARVTRWTAVTLAPPADPRPLVAALGRLAEFDWLIVTSAHAATAVVERVGERPPALRIATVGAATAGELEGAGWWVDHVGRGPGAEALLGELAARDAVAGQRVLFPASALAPGTLERGLATLGARVERVEAYQMLPAPLELAQCRAEVASRRVEAVTFASPSALAGLVAACGHGALAALLARVAVAVIGPTTAHALAAFGRPADAQASPSTLDGLVAATARALDLHARHAAARAAEGTAP